MTSIVLYYKKKPKLDWSALKVIILNFGDLTSQISNMLENHWEEM